MAAVTFASKLNDDGSLAIPREAVEALGLHPGDDVEVRIEAANGAGQRQELDQGALQAKFERFFDNLDTLTFETPTRFPNSDPAVLGPRPILDR